MTRRDLQGEAKKTGRPWEVGKAFEQSAPCSELVPASDIGHPATGAIWLKVNGQIRQEGNLDQMIWKVPRSEEHTSELQSLMRISYAVFCLKKKKNNTPRSPYTISQ